MNANIINIFFYNIKFDILYQTGPTVQPFRENDWNEEGGQGSGSLHEVAKPFF